MLSYLRGSGRDAGVEARSIPSESNAQVQLLSITDELLGVLNRRFLNEKVPDEIHRAQRYSVHCQS